MDDYDMLDDLASEEYEEFDDYAVAEGLDDYEPKGVEVEEFTPGLGGGTVNAPSTHTGITGGVTSYGYSEQAYPCVIFGHRVQVEKYKLQVLKSMVQSGSGNKDITLYYESQGGRYRLGAISQTQVMAVYNLLGVDNISVFLDENTELVGHMKYAL